MIPLIVEPISSGTKQDKLERLIKEIKGESDKVASEIYTWIDQHKKGFETYTNPRDKTRDNTRTNLKENKHDVKNLTKVLKGESDHLANELYTWIDKHTPARDHPRDGAREHPRDQIRNPGQKHQNSHKSSQFLDVFNRAVTRDKKRGASRGLLKGKSLRHHTRRRRAVTESGDGLEGKSIQDVMMDLMNAPHEETTKLRKHKTKKITKAKIKKAKSSVRKFKKLVKAKPKPKKSSKRVKQVKKTKTSKRSKIPKPKVNFATNPTKSSKTKATGLPDLLKLISADPAKKILVSKVEDNIKFDKKSLEIINEIPKPVLKNLLKNINLEKYFRMKNYLPNVLKGKEMKTKAKVKKDAKIKLKKTVRRTSKVVHKIGKNKEIKLIKKAVPTAKKTAVLKGKKAPKKLIKKPVKVKKKATSVKNAKSKTKSSIKVKTSVHAQKDFNGKNRSNVAHAQRKLSVLKEKIKKTNSLKLKVAKALLEHCETQNKLRKIFDNVNASLKEATQLAKAIGKKFGVKKSEVDRMSTEHTEEAVAEFLDKFF